MLTLRPHKFNYFISISKNLTFIYIKSEQTILKLNCLYNNKNIQ
ncbi:hypothetical protein GGQ94_001666 [Petrimonas sulfuriphila]|jgi:hypothetical protein